MRFRACVAGLMMCAIWLTACGGSGTPHAAATCGPPPPVPAPFLQLLYPEPNATDVPDDAGVLVFSGVTSDFFGKDFVELTTPATSEPAGAFTAPPSPLPTPIASPAGGLPLVAAPLPTLSPATTYTVNFVYPDFTGVNPPACVSNVTQTLGAFTTR